jgi:lipopolysaccharide transport system ATP-binding protein
MSEVAGRGRTVLFVSHNMEAIRKICSRAILLDNGEMVSQGTTENIIARYMEDGADAQSVYTIAPPSNEDNAPGYAYRIVIEDGKGNPSSAVPVGSPWQIRVNFRINRRVEHFIIGLGLWANLNITLRASWSAPQTIEPGDYQAVFREETILLATGRYSIGLGLSSFERSFHYIENAAILEIADIAEGIDLVRISGVGVILNPLKIEVQRL